MLRLQHNPFIMINTTGVCLIVLTYKRKILLKRQEDYSASSNKNNWSFIDTKVNQDSFEHAILRRVEKEMSITLPSVTLLSSLFDDLMRKNFYHAELTDKNVNEINRHEGQELQFFSMREVETLLLAESSKTLLSQCKKMLETACSN